MTRAGESTPGFAGRHERGGAGLVAPVGGLAAEISFDLEIDAVMLAQREFLSTVSHEFRTPLSALESAHFLLRQRLAEHGDPRVQRYLEVQAECLAALRKLVDHVVVMKRLESDPPGKLRRRHRLPQLMRDLVDRINAAMPTPRVIFTAWADGEAELDEHLFLAAVDSLISNALKYSAADQRVDVGLARVGDEFEIVVVDRGCGIPVADRDRICTPFFRASNVGGVPGIGLGLSIVRRAVEQHGGRLEFDSVEGFGTCFVLRLPRVASGAPQCAA
jgi:two-component system phosphate regulon sensor histidine kinase PhoR